MNTFLSKIRQAKGKDAEEGSFTIFQQTISPASIYTKNLILSRSDFKMGLIYLHVANNVIYTANRRMAADLIFTTELNDAISMAGGRSSYNVYGCNFTDYWIKGFHYNQDSKLSEVYFFDDGGQAGLRGQLRIESCQIVGSNIELKFRNTHGTRNVRITINGEFRVMR